MDRKRKRLLRAIPGPPPIAVVILTLVLLLVVPLNLISLLLSADAIGKYEGQVRLSLQGTGDVYVSRIDSASRKADLFLYEFLSGNQDLEKLKTAAPGTDDFARSVYRCYQTVTERLRLEELVCACFFRPKGTKEGVFATDQAMGESALVWREQAEGLRACDNLWHVKEWNGEVYLTRYAQEKSFFYGSVLRLSGLLEEIRQASPYESLEVSFGEEEMQEGAGQILSLSQAKRSGLKLQLGVSRSECLKSLSIWTRLLLLGAGLFIVVVPILYTLLKRLIVAPLKALNDGFGIIEGGDQDFRMREDARTAEFLEASRSLNHLVEHMEELRLLGVEKELEKKRLELDNLRLQIRPHFLLNTFNLIYCLLNTPEGTQEARELILYLSNYFRYMFRGEQDLALFDHELELIYGYIRAAQIRYPEEVELDVDIDPEVRLVRIPPLLLHNFIENVVRHALSPERCVHILLVGRYWPPEEWEEQGHIFAGKKTGMVEFEISDDGNGMSPELAEKINHAGNGLQEEGHLGILNAIRRLQAIYGDEAGIQVQSEEGRGTLFTICFPYDLEVVE